MNPNESLKIKDNVEIRSCNASEQSKGAIATSNNIDIQNNDLDDDDTSLENYLQSTDASFASWPR